MRTILSVAFLLLYGWTNAQSTGDGRIRPPQPDYYIDSQKVNFPLTWIDPQNIAHINIPPKDSAHPNGAVYLTWKTPRPAFLNLREISDKESELAGNNVIYIIDDSLIRDTSLVRIEAANVFRIHSLASSQTSYVPHNAGPVSVVLVETKASFQKKPPPAGVVYHIH
jgi:hypothetical protein